MPDDSFTFTKPATLHDVARLAGVSYQTVSRVVNNNPNVAPDTRERVSKAILELDYRPNRAARSLITRRSQTLHLISFNINYFRPVRYIIQAAKDMGYHIGVTLLTDSTSKEDLRQLLSELTARMIDGFLLFDPGIEFVYDEMNKLCRNIPFVQIGACPCPMIPAVVFDQRHGTQLVLRHLLDLGHRQIAEISGLITNNYDGRVRHEMYLEMMKAYDLNPGPYITGDFTIPGGYQAAFKLLDLGKPFTALICGNDELALGALHALHERGLRIPEDISVVGFDDNLEVSFTEPPLTTIRQDYEAISRQSIQYLISLIENPRTPHYQQMIFPQLIVRESTRLILAK
jgi:DNA-binding LacI/PurR family transcriptional regulator